MLYWVAKQYQTCFSMFDVVLILSNTIEEGFQTEKCLIMFGRQTFPFRQGLRSSKLRALVDAKFKIPFPGVTALRPDRESAVKFPCGFSPSFLNECQSEATRESES